MVRDRIRERQQCSRPQHPITSMVFRTRALGATDNSTPIRLTALGVCTQSSEKQAAVRGDTRRGHSSLVAGHGFSLHSLKEVCYHRLRLDPRDLFKLASVMTPGENELCRQKPHDFSDLRNNLHRCLGARGERAALG